jgi:hypothetical protein
MPSSSSSVVKNKPFDFRSILSDAYMHGGDSSLIPRKRQKTEELDIIPRLRPLSLSNRHTSTPRKRGQYSSSSASFIVKQEEPSDAHPMVAPPTRTAVTQEPIPAAQRLSQPSLAKREAGLALSGLNLKTPAAHQRLSRTPIDSEAGILPATPKHQSNATASGSNVKHPSGFKPPSDFKARLAALEDSKPVKTDFAPPTATRPAVEPELKDDIINAAIEDPELESVKQKVLDTFALPDRGDDRYDDEGNFFGRGRDAYQGPQAQANE